MLGNRGHERWGVEKAAYAYIPHEIFSTEGATLADYVYLTKQGWTRQAQTAAGRAADALPFYFAQRRRPTSKQAVAG